jgi:hypothetical protein
MANQAHELAARAGWKQPHTLVIPAWLAGCGVRKDKDLTCASHEAQQLGRWWTDRLTPSNSRDTRDKPDGGDDKSARVHET